MVASPSTGSTFTTDLHSLPSDWRLVRVGRDKAPIAGKGWFDADDFSPDDAAEQNGSGPPAWGLKCGPASGGVLVLDLDGEGWRESFHKETGHPITDLPATIGWTSGKPGRSGHAFTVDSDWWPHLSNVRAITRPWKEGDPVGPKGEKKPVTLWELRWNRVQSVILGAHPETGRYRWLEHRSPAAIPEAAPAPDWLLQVLLIQEHPDAAPVEPTAEDADRAVAMLAKLPPAEFSAYSDWLRVGMALHHTDPGLLTAWRNWSAGMANFDEAELVAKWESFGKGHKGRPASIATLHHLAKPYGYREHRKRKHRPAPAEPSAAPSCLPVSFEALVETLPDGWAERKDGSPARSQLDPGELAGMLTKTKLLRFNQMDGLPEVQTPAGWRSVHESAQDSAYVLLNQKGWIIGIEPIQKAVIHTARLRPFHPVRDYLLNLEQDRAITPFDLDTVAEVFLGTKNTMHVAMVRKWLIGAVARALEPGTKMDYCLVLHGPQGHRKSTFFETLASPDFHCSSVPDHELRFLMNVHSCWLFELAELETVTGRRESGRLKNLLTTAHDWIVAPYGRARERKPRPSVFCGTVNKGLFLHDETGDRRFWVVPIEQKDKIDIDKLRTVRDSIWKAAVTAWRAGEKPMLTDEHVTASEQQNERFRLEDPWRDPIETYLQSTPMRPVKVTDVLRHLEVPTERQTPATAKRVREIAGMLGWEHGRRRHEGGQSAGLWPPS